MRNKSHLEKPVTPGGAGTDTDAIHDNVAGEINAIASAKTTPVDADWALIEDSAASWAKKKLSWANIKATLKAYFDTLYLATKTIGIADNNLVDIDDADAADNDYAKFTATGLEGRDASEAKTDLGFMTDLVDDTSPQLGGDLEYNEKHQTFGTSLTSDNTASGDIITVTFGESVVFGDLVYPDGTEDEWMKALGTNAAVKHPAMGIALETKANGESGKLLLRGLIRDATHFSGFALGDILFLSDATAGAWLNAAPSDSGDIVQILGWVLAANYAYFNPDYTYVEVA